MDGPDEHHWKRNTQGRMDQEHGYKARILAVVVVVVVIIVLHLVDDHVCGCTDNSCNHLGVVATICIGFGA